MAYPVLIRVCSAVFLSFTLLGVGLAQSRPVQVRDHITLDFQNEQETEVSPALQPWYHQAPQTHIAEASADGVRTNHVDPRLHGPSLSPGMLGIFWRFREDAGFVQHFPGFREQVSASVERTRAP